MGQVNFNTENVGGFIAAYNKAVDETAASFNFDGGDYVTKYAYYLIQLLVDKKIVIGIFNDNKKFNYDNF